MGTADYVETFNVSALRKGMTYTATNSVVRYLPDESLWLNAPSMAIVGDAPVLANTMGFMPFWEFRDANNDRIGTTFAVPADWKTVAVDILWFNRGGGSGGVTWRARIGSINGGVALAAAAGSSAAVITATTLSLSKLSRLASSLAVTPGFANLELLRLGSDGGDTVTNTVAVLGVKISRVT